MYICVDFDGTIVDHRYPNIGLEVPGAIKWLNKLHNQGAKFILFTMRSGKFLDEAVSFLEDRGVSLFGVNVNPDQHWSNSPKAYGELYIDDAAFGCPLTQPGGFSRPCVNWDIVGPAVEVMLNASVSEFSDLRK